MAPNRPIPHFERRPLVRYLGVFTRYHGAFTPSAPLTSFQLAGDSHLDRSDVGDRYGGKRAEIAGMTARTQQQLGQFRASLAHVDATIRLFAPAIKPET
ncbi:MAG: hypothetical protein JOY71_25925, partial [Acetobacteraceae bacterium]|nr:hypothetical protein [Acetobacteraceae bacterium]